MWKTRLADPIAAGAAGTVAVALITTVFIALPGRVFAEIPALLMLLVITAVSVLSSWRAGIPVAIAAGVAHSFAFIEPIGEIRLGYTQDVTTILTFVATAIVVSVIVSQRSIANRAELIGRERMLLLRSVGHDVRSPLNVILTASTELRDGADHDPAARDHLLGLVVSETQRLDRIVDNLLNLSRLQAGALVPAMERTPVSELIAACADRFGRIERHPGQITLIEPVPEVEVTVDPIQMEQVLTNLIENAVRHGHDGVHVEVGARIDGAGVALVVLDDGPGIAPATRARLFAPFHSTDGSSGLGLTVCEAIVEAHHGSIQIDDRPGGGTAVAVRLPDGR